MGIHVYVIGESADLMNFLAIYYLELMGWEAPNEKQIESMENILKQEIFLKSS